MERISAPEVSSRVRQAIRDEVESDAIGLTSMARHLGVSRAMVQRIIEGTATLPLARVPMLPPRAFRAVMRALGECHGERVGDAPRSLTSRAMRVGARYGHLALVVERVTDPSSPGGKVVTEQEAAEVRCAARDLVDESVRCERDAGAVGA